MTAPHSSVTTRDLFRFSFHYWGKNRARIALVVLLFALCSVGQNYFVPTYVARLTDLVAHNGDVHAIWHYFILFGAASLVQSMLWTVAIFIWNGSSCRMLYTVLGDALQKVQRFSADWHSNTFAGGTVRKITRGMGSFDVLSDRIFLGFLVIFMAMGITVVTLFTRQPYVALFVVCLTVVYFLLSLYVSVKYQVPLSRRVAQSDTEIGSNLADIITGIPTVKSFAAEDREDDRFEKVRAEWRSRALKSWQTSRYIDGIRTLLRLVMLIGMLGITIALWQQGRASPGDITLALTCFFLTQHLLRDMGTFINDLQKAMSEMEDIVWFWLREDDVKDIGGSAPIAIRKGGGEIAFNNVCFAYANTSKPVYDDLSVAIRPGEKVALVGVSGSGKSTFVKLIQRLYDVQAGRISIDGQNIAQASQVSLRRQIALVPQDPVLFHRSLADNIAYGKPDATQEEIENAARLACAHDFILSFPQGYDTFVGERGVKLSGGERQRVAIARAILADCPILIMDEATSSLDSVSEHYIQEGLQHLMQDRTVIIIAHRLATIRRVDRILVFAEGKIVEEGTHDSLLENPDSVYKRLYDRQALGLTTPHEENAV